MKALTANSLATGEVVFWSGGRWVESFADAERFEGEPAETALAEAKAQATVVVEPYLIDLLDAPGQPPVSYRERLRALGPTNKPDHGKQAAGGEAVALIAAAHGAARSTGRLDLIRRK